MNTTENKHKTIYLFGNLLLPDDSLPLKLQPALTQSFPGYTFVHQDPNENFPPEGREHLQIIDTVQGIQKPTVFDISDLKKIKATPVSPHDYDLLFHLLLLKKLNKIVSAVIYGVPLVYTLENSHEVIQWLAEMLKKE